MSPSYFIGGTGMFYVYSSGYLRVRDSADEKFCVRPVINLRADVELTGDGTVNSPYQIAEIAE